MIWILLPFAIWGLLDLYVFYRFSRKPEIDKTASLTWWWSVKWAFATQTKILAEKLPFVSKDLTEALGIRKDDGEIT